MSARNIKKTQSVERRTSYKSCYGDTALRQIYLVRIIEELFANNGVTEDRIVTVNFEELENEWLQEK